MKGIYKNSSESARLFQLLFVFFFCFISGIIIGILCFGISSSEITTLKILSFIQSVFSFIIPSFILAYLWSDKPFNYLYIKSVFDWKAFLAVMLMMIIAIPFINLMAEFNKSIPFPGFMSGIEEHLKVMEERSLMQTEKLLTARTPGTLLLNLFLIAVIPALGEELFFRATLQRLLQESKPYILAIWTTAFIFSVIHMQFYGFIPRLILGAFFGYIIVWSKNVWLPVFAHFINNAVIVVFCYLSANNYSVPDINALGTGSTWWVGIESGIIFISGFFIIKKYFIKKQT